MSDKNDQPGFTRDGAASPPPGPEIDDNRRRFLRSALIAGSGAVAAPGLIGAAGAQTTPAAASGEGRKKSLFRPGNRQDRALGLFQ